MPQYTVAQIIQGEAGTPAGQFAVAATIQNRVAAGNFGSNALDVVNAPGQFTGHLTGSGGPGAVPALSAVTPQSQAYADAIDNGTLSNYGSTGNALYFQSNQGQPSTVVGGSSVNIGGNYFTDRQGQPSSNFQPPVYGGTDGPSTSPAIQTGSTSGDSVTMGGSANTGDLSQYQVKGVNAPADPISGTSPDASSAGNASAPQGKSDGSGSGTPVDVTNIKDEGLNGANAQASATQDLTKGLAADTGSIATTGTGWLSSIFSGVTDVFVRSGFVLLGIVVLLGAFLFFYIDAQSGHGAATA